MGFMKEYKRLDNLCKDIFNSDIGITTYIEEMNHKAGSLYKPACWDNDYKCLKHYRHIRNKIVHDVDVEEEDLCNQSDIEWIVNFHQRIIVGDDPLAKYRIKSLASNTYHDDFMSDENDGLDIMLIFIILILVLGCIALLLFML